MCIYVAIDRVKVILICNIIKTTIGCRSSSIFYPYLLFIQNYQFMKNKVQLTYITFLILFINLAIGCGGSSSGGSSTNQQPAPVIETQQDNPKPIPHEKCSVTITGESNGVNYKLLSESDYTGDIKFNCSHDENEPTAQKYFLINGVPSLNVSKLKREAKLVSDCKLANSSYINTISVSFDYNSGVVETKSNNTAKGKSSCKSKFMSPLETTIAKQDSIKILLDTWGADVSEANKSKTGLIETDCPQITGGGQNTGEVPVCKITLTEKYTLTDDTGKLHTIDKKLSY